MWIIHDAQQYERRKYQWRMNRVVLVLADDHNVAFMMIIWEKYCFDDASFGGHYVHHC